MPEFVSWLAFASGVRVAGEDGFCNCNRHTQVMTSQMCVYLASLGRYGMSSAGCGRREFRVRRPFSTSSGTALGYLVPYLANKPMEMSARSSPRLWHRGRLQQYHLKNHWVTIRETIHTALLLPLSSDRWGCEWFRFNHSHWDFFLERLPSFIRQG